MEISEGFLQKEICKGELSIELSGMAKSEYSKLKQFDVGLPFRMTCKDVGDVRSLAVPLFLEN